MGRIISGNIVSFEKYTKGLGELYFENGDKYADRVFQIDGPSGKKETFSSVKSRSIRVAINMQKIGVKSKDIILICSKNTMDSSIPHISTLYLGAITGALHHSQSKRDWTHCIKLIQPNFIFVEEEYIKSMEECLENIENKPKLIIFGKSQKHITFDDLQKPSDEETTFRPVSVEDCKENAVVLFSSGTTGPPKGMCMSHYCLINKTILALGQGPFPPTVGLMFSTLFWISSVLQLIYCFYGGSTRVIPSSTFNPREMLEIIEIYKVNFVFINPVLLRAVLVLEDVNKYDTSSLVFLTAVGTPLTESENLKLKKIFKTTLLTQAYGSSETIATGTCFTAKDIQYHQKLNSVGRCSDNCQIKIVHPETRKILGPNEKGEICIKCPFPFNGYYNQDSSDTFDEDGFIKMGDLGYYDDDECFYIEGRIKEVFKYRTYHVPTIYLETILMEHPSVLEASVFGIPHPKDGYHIAACIVLKSQHNVSIEDIERHYTNAIPDWYRLRGGIKIVKTLPKTPTDKVQKNKLIDIFASS